MLVRSVVLLASLYLVITLLVLAAGCAAALAVGLRDRLVVLMSGFGGLGILGFATFWVYLANPRAGRAFGIAAAVACVAFVGYSALRGSLRAAAPLLRSFIPITAFFVANTYFMVTAGYLRGTFGGGDKLGQNRYVAGLPDDNRLPYDLAKQLVAPTRPLPHFLDDPWQASDRPPLQTGAYLMEHAFSGGNNFMHYQIASTVLQCLWPFGVWAFMVYAKLPSRAVALALAATAFAGFTIVNSLFVWPKLLPAAYLMLATAALFGGARSAIRESWVGGAVLGSCIGSAMLCHPGSLFVVIGIAITLVASRMWVSARFLGAAFAASAVLYAPWIWFQQVYNPPGDFLLRYQLANDRTFYSKRPLLQDITDAYRSAGWSGTWKNKWKNLKAPFNGLVHYPQLVFDSIRAGLTGDHATFVVAVYRAKVQVFFNLIPAVGLMFIGIVILAVVTIKRWRDTDGGPEYLRFGRLGLVCLVANYLVWAAVLFGPGSTTIQQGSYYLELVAFCLGVIGWWAISPGAAGVAVAVQSVLALWQYVIIEPLVGLPPNSAHFPVSRGVAAAAIVAFIGVLTALWLVAAAPGDSEEVPGSPGGTGAPDNTPVPDQVAIG